MEVSQDRFSKNSETLSQTRKAFELRILTAHEKIEQSRLENKRKIEESKQWQAEFNQMKTTSNFERQETQMQQLNSIKERVWKRHSKTKARRQK